jgi:hypothetical protein
MLPKVTPARKRGLLLENEKCKMKNLKFGLDFTPYAYASSIFPLSILWRRRLRGRGISSSFEFLKRR